MATSNNNEITVKIKCSFEELEMMLKRQCFKELNKYSTTDIFLIPNEIDIKKETSREILKKAILLREFNGITTNRNSKKITFKKKDINDKGEILSQSSIKCSIDSIEDAKELFKNIGYKEIMKIDELHTSYERDSLKLIAKKNISTNVILIEIETNEKYQTIEQLKQEINKIDIPFDTSNYFVKKAEDELDKIKNNGE